MAYRDSTSGTGSGGLLSVAVPAGVVSGDIVILYFGVDSVDADVPGKFPAGFTQLAETDITADGHTGAIGWKRLTASDAGSYTFGDLGLGPAANWVCQAVAFSGRHATNPPVISTTAVQNTAAASPTVTANGVTAVAGDDLLWVSIPDVTADNAGNGHATPASYVEAEDAENGWANAASAYRNNVSAGATGTVGAVFSTSGGNAGYAAWLVRIPAAATAKAMPPFHRATRFVRLP